MAVPAIRSRNGAVPSSVTVTQSPTCLCSAASVAAPSTTSSGARSPWPDSSGGAIGASGVMPMTGTAWPSMVAVAYQMPVHAATAGSESRTGAASCTLSVVLPELRSKVQFQPYSAGCETSVVRLDPNVIVAIMTTLASTVPRMAGATVTWSRSAPGPNASRTPSAAGTGRPSACAALTARTPSGRYGRTPAAGVRGTRRRAMTRAAPDMTAMITAMPPPSTAQSNATPGVG